MQRKVCEKCGKFITKEEANDSSQRMRKSMKDNDPHIFDVWFWDYCKDCAQKFISQKEQGL